jgi:16S rRNA (uracil1498-N3)-methyltransferase
MNLLLLRPEQYENSGFYCLKDKVLEHLQIIKKVRVGDVLEAGRLDQDMGEFQILEEQSNYFRGIYKPIFKPQKTQNIDIFLSYQRPQTMKKILFLAGTVGIARIFLFPLNKTEKSYIQSNLWKDGKWVQELYLGMEQGKNIYLPRLEQMDNRKKIIPFFQKNHLYVLDPKGDWLQAFSEKDELPPSLQFILGPEGGLTEEDLDFFFLWGAKSRKVSNHILRSEHALAYLMAQTEIIKEIKK